MAGQTMHLQEGVINGCPVGDSRAAVGGGTR